ncbi:hypothetical protein MKW98_013701 [Papaver atlanticum]|uniref:Uncharacterized protein n=1 Tax=Papaver atlanticum TaxID=357466 RepID=A0AAD4SGE2_9MAGN|nr:hypothetical protein MKW98_013701 [Papaver atlanticum]
MVYSELIIGILFGIALMAGWSHMMGRRSINRVAKAVDISFLGSIGRDDVKKICGDYYPEWISFPEYEQVKWLNTQLSKTWPYIGDATAINNIFQSVERLPEKYLPPGITSMKFSKLWLWHVAPRIGGIRVQSLNKGQITMDIDFQYIGDLSIILAVEAALPPSISRELNDLRVFAVLRVIFQLTEDIPCISAVAVALLAEPEPRIDYKLKALGGNLAAIPGLSAMIDCAINTIVTDMLQWPYRIVIPIGGMPADTSDLELKPQGKLSVTVLKANDLKNVDWIGVIDPYAVAYIRPLFKVKTKAIPNNRNPVWNQTFEVIVEDRETQWLIIEVYDRNVTRDERFGIAKLPLNDLEPGNPKEISLRLLPSLDMLRFKNEKDRGTIPIKVVYYEFSKGEQIAAFEEETRIIEERRKLKDAGAVGSTIDAVGSGVGIVGTGIGTGVGTVGSGLGAVRRGIMKAGKFMGRSITGQWCSSKRSGSSTPVTSDKDV